MILTKCYERVAVRNASAPDTPCYMICPKKLCVNQHHFSRGHKPLVLLLLLLFFDVVVVAVVVVFVVVFVVVAVVAVVAVFTRRNQPLNSIICPINQ